MRHTAQFVVALALAATVCVAASAATTGPGGWSDLGATGKAGLNGSVYALNADTFGGHVLFAGGAFTSAGGDPTISHLGAWNGTKWIAVGAPVLNGAVHAIAYNNGRVYAGGVFTNAGGDADADFLAVWDGSTWKPFCNAVGAAFNGNVVALKIIGSTLYIGGSFLDATGIKSADSLVACDLNTGTPQALGTQDGVTGSVYALAADSNGILYAAGAFINMGGNLAADHVAAFNGSAWSSMGSGPSNGGGPVQDIARSITAQGTNVYVGTDSLNIGGIAQADHVAKWNGSAWSAMGSSTDGANGWFPASATILGLATSGSRVFATGTFTDANGDPRADNIASFGGTSWHNVGSNGAGDGPWSGSGLALVAFGDDIVAGGSFTSAGGNRRAVGAASYPLVPDITAPKVTLYNIAPTLFKATQSTAVTYKLSEPAKVTFTLTKAGKKLRVFARTSPAGASKFQLAGRGLTPGGYRLAVVAVDVWGNHSASQWRAFRIIA